MNKSINRYINKWTNKKISKNKLQEIRNLSDCLGKTAEKESDRW